MKKYYLFMLMLTLSCFGTVAQTEQKNTTKAGEEEVFVVVEENPEFPNGMEGLYQFLATNMNYPADAKAKGIEGKVYVTFVVEKDGSVNNIKTIRSPHPMLTEEAERVVKAMPKWKAGKQHGKKVRVQYTLPINFQLDPK
jgi:TonB family protein